MSERFFLLPDGWWRDTTTGLEWSPTATDMMNWDDAARWCEKQGGRLPTRTELYALVDDCGREPCTALPDTHPYQYWSASTRQTDPTSAWNVSFVNGLVFTNFKSNDFYVRAVRGGEKKVAPANGARDRIDQLASFLGKSRDEALLYLFGEP